MPNTSDSGAPPATPAAPPSIGAVNTGGDAYLGSNVNNEQRGGVRVGAGAQINGSVGARIFYHIYNYGVPPAGTGPGGQPNGAHKPPTDEEFAVRYLENYILEHYGHFHAPLAELPAGPGRPGGAAPGQASTPEWRVPDKLDLLEAFVPIDLAPLGGKRVPPDRSRQATPWGASPSPIRGC